MTGGVAVYAEQPGSSPNYIFPFMTAALLSVTDLQFQYLMYRPLYWFGINGKISPMPNPKKSLAQPPVYSDGNTRLTITLKPYVWSDGEPVEAANVVFWINLLRAEKQNWADYVPGAFPDDLASVKVLGQRQLELRLTAPVSPLWFTGNELSQITPLPRAWDLIGPGLKGSCSTAVTTCPAVYRYLTAQAKNISSYGNSPIWQVVDGPWRLKSFTTQGEVTVVPNRKYAGTDKPRLSGFKMVPFTSQASEYAVLRSGGGGGITVGYVPPEDLVGNSNPLSGYQLAPLVAFAINAIVPNFNNPSVGPFIRQLYIRQALAHLVEQETIIRVALNGHGHPTYGPVPLAPPNPYVTEQQRHNPYPFSVSAARSLLGEHGWTVRPNSVSTCARPGTASNQCGAGIKAGTKLEFSLIYSSGVAWSSSAMQDFKSEASKVGIMINLGQVPTNELFAREVPCKPSQSVCSWQMVFYEDFDVYGPYPTGEFVFATGATANYSSYEDRRADQLIRATTVESGLGPLYAYENYIAKQLPVIWAPYADASETAVSDRIRGVLPQNPIGGFLTPEDWHFVQ